MVVRNRFVLMGAAFAVSLAPGAFGQLRSQVYATGLSLPVLMVQDPTQPDTQFVLQQRGRIRTVVNGVVQTPDFLDLTGIASTSGSERGLLGLAFHPNYASNRYFYVNYTDVPSPGNTRIVRYTRNAINPNMADIGSAFPILTIAQPFTNHNGGTLRFGPDGYLYIGMGDGGSANDPGNRAQTITNMLLGKMLRIDVNGDDFPADPNRNYAIPPTNPFVGVVGDDEIWSFGLRNPWKWCFDNPAWLGTGGMLIGDVGQNAWEEIDYEPPLRGGRNYGWRQYEGNALTGNGGGVGPPYYFPIHVYDHSQGISVTGGYVYRGLMLGDYFGKYFFADYGSANIWTLDLVINPQTGEGSAANVTNVTSDVNSGASSISSIDVDSQGELYIVDYGGGRIIKILPENRAWATGFVTEYSGDYVGQLRGLSAADGKDLRTFNQLAQELIDANLSSLIVFMKTDAMAASFFDVFVDVKHNEQVMNGSLRVFLRNVNTNLFELKGTFPITNTYQTHSLLNIPAGNYRRGDGTFDVKLEAFNNNNVPVDPYVVYYDRLKVVPH